jgi:hypothetical protein
MSFLWPIIWLADRLHTRDGYWDRSVPVVGLSTTPRALCLNGKFYAKSVWRSQQEGDRGKSDEIGPITTGHTV